MRTTNASSSGSTGGRPGALRCMEPSNFWATSVRCQPRIVSGVSVQVMKTSFLRARLHMAYPTTMETLAALPPDIWARTPPEAQAYIRVLEVRVAALESEMQALHAQLQQTSQNSSRPPSSDPPQ